MNQIWVGHTSESCIETVINILEAADSVETSLADFRPYYIVTPTASLAEFYSAELARKSRFWRDCHDPLRICSQDSASQRPKPFRGSILESLFVKLLMH